MNQSDFCKQIFLVLTLLLMSPSQALPSSLDIYVNEVGGTCVMLVDFEPLVKKDQTLLSAPQRIEKEIQNSLKSPSRPKCKAGAEQEVHAIRVKKKDNYGQADWGSVEVIGKYKVVGTTLRALK